MQLKWDDRKVVSGASLGIKRNIAFPVADINDGSYYIAPYRRLVVVNGKMKHWSGPLL